MFNNSIPSPLQEIIDPSVAEKEVVLWMKRDDLLHPHISGNKWRKLKYNIHQAKKENHDTILTFGGAYSNHIYATAVAARENGFKSIGVIRGEQQLPLNPTLDFVVKQGMKLIYKDRGAYRSKSFAFFLNNLKEELGKFYLIPEGGTNELAIKGCTEIVPEIAIDYDYICASVGTGGTLSGIITAINKQKKVIGFSALKGDFLKEEIHKLLVAYNYSQEQNWDIINSYHFNGYAKISPLLINFIKTFFEKHQILLDPIYTGKMMFGLFDLIGKGYFPRGSKIIALHTGGLQGWAGIKKRYGNKAEYDFTFTDQH